MSACAPCSKGSSVLGRASSRTISRSPAGNLNRPWIMFQRMGFPVKSFFMFGREGESGHRVIGSSGEQKKRPCKVSYTRPNNQSPDDPSVHPISRPPEDPMARSPDGSICSPDLLHGFVHGHNVLRGDIGQDIVNLLEDEAATGTEDLYLFFDVPAHFVRPGVRQDGLRVAASAPEYHVLPEFSL